MSSGRSLLVPQNLEVLRTTTQSYHNFFRACSHLHPQKEALGVREPRVLSVRHRELAKLYSKYQFLNHLPFLWALLSPLAL